MKKLKEIVGTLLDVIDQNGLPIPPINIGLALYLQPQACGLPMLNAGEEVEDRQSGKSVLCCRFKM